MQTRNCLVRDHPRGETSSSYDLLLFALLPIPANLLWIPDKVTSSGQTSSGYHFLLLDAISSQPAVDKMRTAAFFFPSSKCQAACSILLPRSPNPPSLPHVRIPPIPIGLSTIPWGYHPPTSLYMACLCKHKKSQPYHISRLCKESIDIAEWSHLKNLLKSCFHQFPVFFKGNLIF